jgi:hypothetical protein
MRSACWFPCGGRPEVVAARRCAAAADNWSRVASRLIRDGRQPVEPVRPKGCLSRILVWRSNRLPKIKCAGKERFLSRKEIVKKNLGYCSLNKNINF